MITVQRKKGQITVSGHAGYAEKGHDIVCAAVSILIYNLQNSIERLTDDTVGFFFLLDRKSENYLQKAQNHCQQIKK